MAKKNSNHEIQLRIQNALLEQDYVHAEQLLESLKIANTIDKVYKTKTLALLAISQFQYQKAYDLLNQLSLAFPLDIEIKANYIFVLHHLGLNIELNDQVIHFIQIWNNESQFIKKDVFSSGVLVAKICEELGKFNLSQNILDNIQEIDLSPYQKQSLFLQKMRLSIELRQKDFVLENYHLLSSGTQFNQEFLVERLHILLLADYYIGDRHRIDCRIEEIKKMKLHESDYVFLNSEIIENQIIHRFDLPAINFNQQISDSLIYENYQLILVNHKLSGLKNSLIPYLELEKKLSPMLLLRLLRQHFLIFPEDMISDFIKNKYIELCQNIQPKKTMNHYLSFLPKSNNFHLEFSPRTLKLIKDDKSLDVQSELYLKFIELFIDSQIQLSLEEVVSRIYNEELNTQHYDRIRVTTTRFNKLIQSELQLQNLFKVSKNTLCITTPIRKAAE